MEITYLDILKVEYTTTRILHKSKEESWSFSKHNTNKSGFHGLIQAIHLRMILSELLTIFGLQKINFNLTIFV